MLVLMCYWGYGGSTQVLFFSFPGPIKSHGSFSLEINKYKNERVNRNDQSSGFLFFCFLKGIAFLRST